MKGGDLLIVQKVHICPFIREKCAEEVNIVKESFEVLRVINKNKLEGTLSLYISHRSAQRVLFVR